MSSASARVLVQILLPLFDADGVAYPAASFRATREALVSVFGGLTAYTRAPAEGRWEEPAGGRSRDDIVIYEVMCERVEVSWWLAFRSELERTFQQRQIVMRAQDIRVL